MAGQYIELLCSLPYLADPFVHRRPPISWVQLTKRLNMLEYADRQLIQELAGSFYWGSIAIEDSDRELVERARHVVDHLEHQDLREWVFWRMDFRTVIAGLRRRHRGEEAAPVGLPWGFGRYTRFIERNWTHPTFHLEHRFPWLPEAQTLLEAGESYELERLLLTAAWRYYSTRQPDNEFGLSALWLYLMRWDLVERWCSYDTESARQRFGDMVSSALTPHLEQVRQFA